MNNSKKGRVSPPLLKVLRGGKDSDTDVVDLLLVTLRKGPLHDVRVTSYQAI